MTYPDTILEFSDLKMAEGISEEEYCENLLRVFYNEDYGDTLRYKAGLLLFVLDTSKGFKYVHKVFDHPFFKDVYEGDDDVKALIDEMFETEQAETSAEWKPSHHLETGAYASGGGRGGQSSGRGRGDQSSGRGRGGQSSGRGREVKVSPAEEIGRNILEFTSFKQFFKVDGMVFKPSFHAYEQTAVRTHKFSIPVPGQKEQLQFLYPIENVQVEKLRNIITNTLKYGTAYGYPGPSTVDMIRNIGDRSDKVNEFKVRVQYTLNDCAILNTIPSTSTDNPGVYPVISTFWIREVFIHKRYFKDELYTKFQPGQLVDELGAEIIPDTKSKQILKRWALCNQRAIVNRVKTATAELNQNIIKFLRSESERSDKSEEEKRVLERINALDYITFGISSPFKDSEYVGREDNFYYDLIPNHQTRYDIYKLFANAKARERSSKNSSRVGSSAEQKRIGTSGNVSEIKSWTDIYFQKSNSNFGTSAGVEDDDLTEEEKEAIREAMMVGTSGVVEDTFKSVKSNVGRTWDKVSSTLRMKTSAGVEDDDLTEEEKEAIREAMMVGTSGVVDDDLLTEEDKNDILRAIKVDLSKEERDSILGRLSSVDTSSGVDDEGLSDSEKNAIRKALSADTSGQIEDMVDMFKSKVNKVIDSVANTLTMKTSFDVGGDELNDSEKDILKQITAVKTFAEPPADEESGKPIVGSEAAEKFWDEYVAYKKERDDDDKLFTSFSQEGGADTDEDEWLKKLEKDVFGDDEEPTINDVLSQDSFNVDENDDASEANREVESPEVESGSEREDELTLEKIDEELEKNSTISEEDSILRQTLQE